MENYKDAIRIKQFNRVRERALVTESKITQRFLPKNIVGMLSELKIMEVSDYDERAKLIIEYFKEKKYTSKTAMDYFSKIVSTGVLGDTSITVNSIYFDQIAPPQIRVPNINEFDKMMELCTTIIDTHMGKFVETNISQRSDNIIVLNKMFAIRFAFLSSLRIAEVCAITNQHLYELLEQKPTILIHRKTSEEWDVIYYKHFTDLLDQMKLFYSEYYQLYDENRVVIQLFNMKKRALQYAIRQLFIDANHKLPPVGFGMHTFRYIMGTRIVATGDIETARIILGHKSTEMTKVYTRYDAFHTEKILKEIAEKDEYYKTLNDIFLTKKLNINKLDIDKFEK